MPLGPDYRNAVYFRAALEDVMYQHGVNLFFDGHQHSFGTMLESS